MSELIKKNMIKCLVTSLFLKTLLVILYIMIINSTGYGKSVALFHDRGIFRVASFKIDCANSKAKPTFSSSSSDCIFRKNKIGKGRMEVLVFSKKGLSGITVEISNVAETDLEVFVTNITLVDFQGKIQTVEDRMLKISSEIPEQTKTREKDDVSVLEDSFTDMTKMFSKKNSLKKLLLRHLPSNVKIRDIKFDMFTGITLYDLFCGENFQVKKITVGIDFAKMYKGIKEFKVELHEFNIGKLPDVVNEVSTTATSPSKRTMFGDLKLKITGSGQIIYYGKTIKISSLDIKFDSSGNSINLSGEAGTTFADLSKINISLFAEKQHSDGKSDFWDIKGDLLESKFNFKTCFRNDRSGWCDGQFEDVSSKWKSFFPEKILIKDFAKAEASVYLSWFRDKYEGNVQLMFEDILGRTIQLPSFGKDSSISLSGRIDAFARIKFLPEWGLEELEFSSNRLLIDVCLENNPEFGFQLFGPVGKPVSIAFKMDKDRVMNYNFQARSGILTAKKGNLSKQAVNMTDISASGNARPDNIFFDKFTCVVLGGKIKGQGSLGLESMDSDISFKGSGLELRNLAPYFKDFLSGISGKIDMFGKYQTSKKEDRVSFVCKLEGKDVRVTGMKSLESSFKRYGFNFLRTTRFSKLNAEFGLNEKKCLEGRIFGYGKDIAISADIGELCITNPLKKMVLNFKVLFNPHNLHGKSGNWLKKSARSINNIPELKYSLKKDGIHRDTSMCLARYVKKTVGRWVGKYRPPSEEVVLAYFKKYR